MRHHLRHIHLSPLPLRCWLQCVDTQNHFVDGLCFEQVTHSNSPFFDLNRENDSTPNDPERSAISALQGMKGRAKTT